LRAFPISSRPWPRALPNRLQENKSSNEPGRSQSQGVLAGSPGSLEVQAFTPQSSILLNVSENKPLSSSKRIEWRLFRCHSALGVYAKLRQFLNKSELTDILLRNSGYPCHDGSTGIRRRTDDSYFRKENLSSHGNVLEKDQRPQRHAGSIHVPAVQLICRRQSPT
jgi:hypothetical protein